MYKQYSATFEILAEMETKQVQLHCSSVDLVSFIYTYSFDILTFSFFILFIYFFFYITISV